ncbi:unnamed protein product [Triticum turgidum subsp. durum]|uniref:Ubiquitin-like domain-containing protein n=1 Tax=Triticum turgidum subsp. durum TaxID=4567 RepID=A0A9R1SA29_TRITD|nr:unnamed protein product [Triticum turgidum subsp. durum]
MYILVKNPAGRMIRLRVRPLHTLGDVKTIIQQRHFLVSNGVQLDDNCTLAGYNIQHESTLELQEKMQICVTETLMNRTIPLDVDSLDTIDDVKANIYGLQGFPSAQQCLIFASKRLEEGNRTLADHNIIMESTILLVLLPCISRGDMMQIHTKSLSGKTISLEVGSLDTVESVMVKLYEKNFASYPSQQRLIFAGKTLEIRRTLAYYNISSDSTLCYVPCLCGC